MEPPGEAELMEELTTLRERLAALEAQVQGQQEGEEALAERTRHLEAVRAVSFEITQELDLATVLRLVAERASELTGAAAADIDLWDEDRQLLVPEATYGHTAPRPRITRRLGEGAMGTVAQTRRGLILNDYRASPLAHPRTLADTHITASLIEPLLYRDRLLGVIGVDHEIPGRTFSDRDQATLRLFAAQAAIAIENARLYESSRQELRQREAVEADLRSRTAQLEAVRAVSVELTRELDLSRLLQMILEQALRLVKTDSGTLFLWDEATQHLVPRANRGLGDWILGIRLRLGEGIVGFAGKLRQSVRVDEYWDAVQLPPEIRAEHPELATLHAAMAEPLLYQGQLRGAIIVRSEVPGRVFADAEQQVLAHLAAQAVVAIENARLFTEVKQRNQELQALFTVTNMVTRSLDIASIAKAALLTTIEVLHVDAGRLYVFDEQDHMLHLAAHHGLPPEIPRTYESYAPGQGIIGRIFQEGQPNSFADITTDPKYATLARTGQGAQMGFRSAAGLPILVQGKPVGVIYMFGRTVREFSPEDIALLSAIGGQVGIAIENARLYAELKASYERLHTAQAELVRSEQLRGLGQMAAGIAHDLNNMLAAVLGQAELLKLRTADPAFREALATLERAATDGAATVRRLQEFARPKGTSPLGPCDLAAIVQEALEFTRPHWQDAPQRRGRVIQVEVAIPADLPHVLGYPPELREALTNLIFNAVDAMPHGGTLAFAARPIPGVAEEQRRGDAGEPSPLPPGPSAPLRFVELTVRDTGIGMPAEIQAKLFEPFFTTKGVQGSGLGLAVVYGIVERHGGTIRVASAPGKGTTFTLTFQSAAQASTPPATAPFAAAEACRFLMVDDESVVREALAALLRAVGHTVTEAADGPSALALLATTAVDVVCTDLGMPGMSGWEVARQVKARRPDLPVILLTGWSEQAVGNEPNRQWVDAVLGKPVRLAEFLATLAALKKAVDGAKGVDSE